MNLYEQQERLRKIVEDQLREQEPSLRIKTKKLDNNAVIPEYAHDGDGAMDLTAVSISDAGSFIEYGTGLAMEIPYGYVGLLFPRSSISKKDLCLANCVGIIDHQYRGEVKLRFKNTLVIGENEDYEYKEYEVGDKVGQIMVIPRPKVKFVESKELSDTERGEGGFGSTGK